MKAISTAILFLMLSSFAQAQDPAGCADAMAVEGRPHDMERDAYGNLHVAGAAGMYTSCDNGDEWTTSPGSSWPAISLHANHTNPDLILYGTSNGVYRSFNRGFTFERRGQSIDGAIFSIASGPDGRLFAGTDSGVYASDDAGETWTLLTNSPAGLTIPALLVSPDDSRVIYVGNNGGGVFGTTDGGESWYTFGNGQPNWEVWELVFEPGNSSVLLAASRDGIWRSADGGVNWSKLVSGEIFDLTFDPSDSLIAYAVSRDVGLLRSNDGGSTWLSVSDNPPFEPESLLSVGVANDGTVLVGAAFDGVYKSPDKGATWNRSGQDPSPPAPPSPPEVEVGSASLAMDIAYLGGEDSIPSGESGRFRITIRNNGPDPATNTEVQLSWFRSPLVGSNTSFNFTVSSSQGNCARSITPEPDCRLGTIQPGGAVEIQLSGSTKPGALGWYTLRANVQSPEGGATQEFSIGTSVTVLDSDSGGGAASWLLLLCLSILVGVLRIGTPQYPQLRAFRTQA